MAVKKEKINILDDLLGGPHFDQIPGLEELNDLVKRCAQPREDELTFDDFPLKKKGKSRKDENQKLIGKKRITHYLSSQLAAELDDTKESLIKLMAGEYGTRVTKSLIIEQALKVIMNDFEIKGEKSALVKRILAKNSK
ncbi:MAG: hypothetical protein KKE17_04335 [Proteobacteria bacterium]|nr:hypothetical protein [Pseudomonadota bacterium]MBU1709214.1 hypothetical protein [Pseudomonadota bacterium]